MIDLGTWNLSLPVGAPPITITAPQLVRGYQDRNFTHINGKIYFWAPVTGLGSKNSPYARSELREADADGTQRNWNYPGGNHSMRAGVTVTQISSVGKVVIGQIHVKYSTSPLLKLEYQYSHRTQTGKVVAKVRHFPTDITHVYTVAPNVPLNQRFTYSINLSSGGTLSIWVDSANWKVKLDNAWKTQPLYFKAGVYAPDNVGPSTEGQAATFDKLEIEHRPL